MKRALIVFAKEPKKDRVKTRLAGCLSQIECLNLYKQLLKNVVAIARNVKGIRRIIAYDPDNGNPSFLKKIASDFEFYKQNGADLGERLFNTFKNIAINNTKAVIIGSDSPNLPESYIKKAFDALNTSDLVLGPAYDGGYYLVGLKHLSKELFEGMKWSSGSLLKETLEKAKGLKKKVTLIDPWYDIDTPGDLKYIKPGFCIRRG